MTTTSQQPNVKNDQPALDFKRPFMDDKTTAISDSRALTTKTGPAETVANPCTRA